MKYVALILTLLIGVTGCSSLSDQAPKARASYVASVAIDTETSRSWLETAYGGKVTLFAPEAGFALITYSEQEAALLPLSSDLQLEANLDTYATPSFSAQGLSEHAGGVNAWSGGVNAWSGGVNAWSGGVNAWSGGVNAWSGGFEPWDGSSATWQGSEPTFTPMDNFYTWQQIGLYTAQTELAPKLGEGVVVAVIDTGIDLTHPVFKDRLVPGYDFVSDDLSPQEETGRNYGHGSAVAGVILQVAPKAKIMPLRVLDGNGVGDTDNVARAIYYAVQHGANIINLSLGSLEDSEVVSLGLEWAKKNKIPVVASSGNSGDQRVTFPARNALKGKYKKVLISVGSVNRYDEKSLFSTYEKDYVEIAAPGEFIFSVYPDNQVTYWSGTSFAAPIVSGGIALALGQMNLKAENDQLPDEISKESENQFYKLDRNKAYKDQLGKGRIDLVKFLSHVLK